MDIEYIIKDECRKRRERDNEIEILRAKIAEYIEAYAAQAQELKDAWERNAALLVAFNEVKHSLQFANDSPNGPIQDTVWMMHDNETLFDFIDSALTNSTKFLEVRDKKRDAALLHSLAKEAYWADHVEFLEMASKQRESGEWIPDLKEH